MSRIHPFIRRARPGEITPATAADLIGLSKATVLRLFHAGYVKGRQPSPRVIWLRKASVIAFKRQTEADPTFWETHSLAGF